MTLNLDEIRQRAERATRAPFEHCDTIHGDVWGRSGTEYVGHLETREDAEFLIHARTDVPALCDEVERLRAEVTHWQANHDEQVRRNFALTYRTDLDVGKVRDRVELVQRYDSMWAALDRIARWFGEFPMVESRGEMVSYAVAYGSNGERDYMRRVARDALANGATTEFARLRDVAQRVMKDFAPYQEVEHVDNGPDDPKEVPTGELLCGSCAQGIDYHDADCLYALAERALANGGAGGGE